MGPLLDDVTGQFELGNIIHIPPDSIFFPKRSTDYVSLMYGSFLVSFAFVFSRMTRKICHTPFAISFVVFVLNLLLWCTLSDVR